MKRFCKWDRSWLDLFSYDGGFTHEIIIDDEQTNTSSTFLMTLTNFISFGMIF